MQKLYKRSEIGLALCWIGAYVIGAGTADAVSEAIGIAKSVTLPFLLFMSAAALRWIGKNGLRREFGLCRPSVDAKGFLYYVPLALLVSANLWFGARWNAPLLESTLYFLSMLCVGFLEEIIFRGFLFRAMSRSNLRAAMIVSSVTFGIGHIVNLLNGADLISNLCQVISAVAFGFLFVLIFHRSGSLLPCIITHASLNALDAFANHAAMTGGVQIAVTAAMTIICVAYTLVLLRTLPKNQ